MGTDTTTPIDGSSGEKDTAKDSSSIKPDHLMPQGVGHIVYNLPNKRAYLIEARDGAKPVDISAALEKFGSSASDVPISIAKDGKFLLVSSERFNEGCKGWNCLAVVPIDLSHGEVILVDGQVVRTNDQAAIASGGNTVVYTASGDKNLRDVWVIQRISGNAWSKPINLTQGSPYNWNEYARFSSDGRKVVLSCGTFNTKSFSLCEVGTDGQGFKVLLTPDNGPAGTPDTAVLRHPDYAPDGSIIFEADWDGEWLWRLMPGAKTPVLVSSNHAKDNSPCVLPNGYIVSLWLDRPGGQGFHELKVMSMDGSETFVLTPDVDVYDSAIYCGN